MKLTDVRIWFFVWFVTLLTLVHTFLVSKEEIFTLSNLLSSAISITTWTLLVFVVARLVKKSRPNAHSIVKGWDILLSQPLSYLLPLPLYWAYSLQAYLSGVLVLLLAVSIIGWVNSAQGKGLFDYLLPQKN